MFFGGHVLLIAQTFHSLDEIWHYADKNSIHLITATNNKSKAERMLKQAKGNLLPSLTTNAMLTSNFTILAQLIPEIFFNPNAKPGQFALVQFGQKFLYNANIVASLNILKPDDWYNIKNNQLNLSISTLQLSQAKRDLYEQLANSYYLYVLNGQIEKLTRENLISIDTITAIATRKYHEGLINDISLNTSLINQAKAEQNFLQTQQNKAVQLNLLKEYLNIPLKDTIAVDDSLTVNDPVNIAHNPFANSPDVQIAEKKMLISKNNVTNSRLSGLPFIGLNYQGLAQVSNNSFFKFSGGTSYFTPQQYLNLQLNLPIFQGGRRFHQTGINKLTYINDQKNYEQQKINTEIENENLLIKLNNSWDLFSKSIAILDLYRKNNFHSEQQLEQGTISVDDRLKVYSDFVSYQTQYLQDLNNFLSQYYAVIIRQTNF